MSSWKRKIELEPNWERSVIGKLWTRTGDNVAPSNEVTEEEARRGTYLNINEAIAQIEQLKTYEFSPRVMHSGFPIDPHNSARYRFPAGCADGHPSQAPSILLLFLRHLAARSDVKLNRPVTKRAAFLWSVMPGSVAYYLIQHTSLTPEQAITIRSSVPSSGALLPESYVDVLNGMPVEWAIMRDSIKLESREPA